MHRQVWLQRATSVPARVADRDVGFRTIAPRIPGAGHFRATEDVLGDIFLIRHTRYFFDDGAEGDVAAIAILIALAGREVWRQAAHELEVIRVRSEAILRRLVEFGSEEVRQSRAMREQLLHGGAFADRLRIFGKELAERVVRRQLSVTNQLADCSLRELLVDRSQVEARANGIGDLPFTVGHAVGLHEHRHTVARHQRDAGEHIICRELREVAVETAIDLVVRQRPIDRG